MFTGIVAGTGKISSIAGDDVIRFVIDFSTVSTDGLVTGASVSVDGVCLTVVEITLLKFRLMQSLRLYKKLLSAPK